MANTLKFGNGNWATKEDSLLAYNSENGNFKPLPFDFTRASSATVVNKAGLIETVGSGKARIDFSNDAKGALLLEPTRSNDLQKSQEFNDSYWTKYQSSVLDNLSISPDGSLNADKLIEDNSAATHQLGRAISYVSGTTYTVSIFAKSSNRNLEISAGNTSTFPAKAIFDLSNGIVLSTTLGNASIENFGNGWYRCVISSTAASTSTTNINFGIVNGSALSYNGDGSSFLELFGVSREIGSYATSYIPTSGSAVTRVADACSQTPTTGIIGQTEGTVFINFDYLNSTGERRFIFQLGTGGDTIYARIESGQTLTSQVLNSGSGLTTTGTALPIGINKLAIAYASNDAVIYLNGVQIAITTSITIPSLSDVYIGANSAGVQQISGINKEFKIYNTRLSNTELQTLTT